MARSPTSAVLAIFLVLYLRIDYLDAQEKVTVTQGEVQGTTMVTRNGRKFPAFIGIPYAQPPVGQLRFRAPLPAESWNETLMAVTDANQCPQDDDFGVTGSEDCLYLNVYTPAVNPSTLYPTMVYIHGGQFIWGNSSTTSTGPEYIMDKDVVLVTLNYRLGALGFLSTGDAEAPGNFGLKDQVLALRWVQENIKNFGGDPDRVTLFGQSAGSVSVNLHVLSDSSKGLFNKYITQSGSSLCFWGYIDIDEYKQYAFALGDHLNCSTNNSRILMDCLRNADVQSIVESNDIFPEILRAIRSWVPTSEPDIEGAFLTMSPIKAMLQNKMRDYPWLTGNVADEGLIFTSLLYVNNTLYHMIADNLEPFLTQLFENVLDVKDAKKFADSIQNFYFAGNNASDKEAFTQNMTNLITDVGFLFPAILHMQIALQHMANQILCYMFDFRGTISKTIQFIGNNEDIGVTHTDDLIYLFPLTPTQVGFPELKFNKSDEQIIDVMVDFWTSFATNGTPMGNSSSDLDIWQPYKNEMSYLQIGADKEPVIISGNYLHEERMQFWVTQLVTIAIKQAL